MTHASLDNLMLPYIEQTMQNINIDDIDEVAEEFKKTV